MEAQRTPIAVICHGPWLLLSADLTRGHTLASYFTIRDDIKNSGGHWLDKEVFAIITASAVTSPAISRHSTEKCCRYSENRSPRARQKTHDAGAGRHIA
ncbi:MAG: DJ-1/PfpI family protein [Candidatus Acidiferrales bacterium]